MESNKQRACAFMDSFASMDPDRILSFTHADVRWWISGSLPGLSGTRNRTQARELLLVPMATVYEPGSFRMTVTGLTAEGERVAVESSSSATLRNGRLYRNTFHFLLVFENGLIREVKEYIDSHHAWEIFLQP